MEAILETTAFSVLSSNLTLYQHFPASEEEETLSPAAFRLAAVVLFLIFMLGSSSNLLIIVIMIRNRNLRTSMNTMLLNLSIGDFTISFLGTPLSFVSAVYNRWIFGETLCHIYAFMMTLTGMTAIGTVTAIAIERYVIISRPFHSRNVRSGSSSLTILVIWIYSLAQATPPLLGWNEYVLERPGIACSVQWQTRTLLHSSYIIYIFVLGYVLPVSIMVFCYFKIVMIIKTAPKVLSQGSIAKAEHKVTLMAWTMVICTVTAWTPYAVVSLILALGYPELIGPAVSICPALFAKMGVLFNPVVYFFLNSEIRDAILEYIPCDCWKANPPEGNISLETRHEVTINNTLTSGGHDRNQVIDHNQP